MGYWEADKPAPRTPTAWWLRIWLAASLKDMLIMLAPVIDCYLSWRMEIADRWLTTPNFPVD
jgi:hypothetical protein